MESLRNKAITIFSPGGRLYQVEYAHIGVKKGSTAVGVCGTDCVVIGLEEKQMMPQQMERSSQRIFPVTQNLMISYAGMTPDARVLVARARAMCTKNRLFDQPVTVEEVCREIADLQLKHTRAHDCRPFGVSCLVAGVDPGQKWHLYQTNPCGNYFEYRATAVGRYEHTAKEFLESVYAPDLVSTRNKTIQLVINTLLQIARPGKKDFEVSFLYNNNEVERLGRDEVAGYVAAIEKQSEEQTRK